MSAATKKLATFADLDKLGDVSAEVVHGVIVEKAAPTFEHSSAQSRTSIVLSPYDRRGGGGPKAPGGWWFGSEVDIEFAVHEVYRPDVAGWRRDRHAARPSGWPVRVPPDWVCEVLSESNARHDLQTKLASYHQFRVPHYWILDPERALLTAHRWREEGYLVARTAGRGDRVRVEPFEALEIQVGVLFGDDPEDE